MIAPVWKPWAGLEALYLGEIIVGRVCPHRRPGDDRADWVFGLSQYPTFWKTARSLDQAKTEVELALAEWLRLAGLA